MGPAILKMDRYVCKAKQRIFLSNSSKLESSAIILNCVCMVQGHIEWKSPAARSWFATYFVSHLCRMQQDQKYKYKYKYKYKST